ncbi:mannose-1-phosphate guanylyltransferase [Bifidobacterium aquikefiricola]|uniref:Mannose-1-phosphate guanylyltransferase n=1 Tax=Bifidobacterium aquikefiricola TaxID=3059038 RepID=A0AB39U7R7_9BIFI
MTIEDFHAIIPAGGVGTRLWPLSRKAKPKFLYDMVGSGQTLIQSTYNRLVPLCGADHIYVSTGERHVSAICEQLPELDSSALFPEPSPRDSTAAIALAAAVIARRFGAQTVVGSFAADHVIRNNAAFAESVRQAVVTARAGYVTTIGIATSRPSTAFGYIHEGRSLASEIQDAPQAHLVESFVEKPDAQTAQAYLETGEYRWNAGIFIMRADVMLDSLHQTHPDIYKAIQAIAQAWDQGEEQRSQAMKRWWNGIEKIAFDYAVAEPVAAKSGVAVIPGGFGWDDVGDFNSVAALLPSSNRQNIKVLGDSDDLVYLDSAGDVVAPQSGRTIALLGVDDLIVIDTPDALLVAPRARSQEVKDMVAHLAESGHDDIL